MPRTTGRQVEIEYEVFGDPSDEPLVLISGLGAQLLFWKVEFCERLVSRGFRVIRFDNRDVGLSTHLHELGVPDIAAVRAGTVAPPYTIEDMAGDAVAVLDAIGVTAAHVVGISLGGYVAQEMAIAYPDRVLSLVSMMSGIGGADNVFGGYPHRAEEEADPPTGDDERIERRLRQIEWMSNPAYFDRERTRSDIIRAMERADDPAGAARQTAAVHGGASRAEKLAKIAVPTLVVHGARDPDLLPVNAHRTAEAIPDAELVIFDDLGHELPPEYWDTVIGLVAANAARHARS